MCFQPISQPATHSASHSVSQHISWSVNHSPTLWDLAASMLELEVGIFMAGLLPGSHSSCTTMSSQLLKTWMIMFKKSGYTSTTNSKYLPVAGCLIDWLAKQLLSCKPLIGWLRTPGGGLRSVSWQDGCLTGWLAMCNFFAVLDAVSSVPKWN